MKKTRTLTNVIFQTLYQVLNTCLPLLTAPFLSRVLGSEQLGIYSYTSSIVSIFALFAMLGTVNYGTRSISTCGEDKEFRSKCFWEIYLFQILSTLISACFFLFYLFVFVKDNFIILFIQTITFLSCLTDINWLFFGCEKFKITITRNFIIRIITVLLIILLVRTKSDLWIYVLLMVASTLISNLLLWLYAFKLIHFKHVDLKALKKHVKPNLYLFVPLLAMSFYHIMDRTFLGILSTNEESGYYYNADKIVNIPIGVLSGFGTVMLPKMSKLIEDNKTKEAFKVLSLSLEGVFVMAIAMALGISSVSKEFVPVFFGSGFDPCVLLIIVLSPVLLVKGISNTIRSQYLIPLHKEKVFIISVFGGALANIVLDICLIPYYGALGAVIGTLAAEIIAMVIQIFSLKKYVSIGSLCIKMLVYASFGAIMIVSVRLVSLLPFLIWVKLLVEFFVGALVYCSLVLLYWRFSKSIVYSEVIIPYFFKSRKGKYVCESTNDN